MTCAGKIANLASVDFISAGAETPYFGVSAASLNPISGSLVISKDSVTIASIPLKESLDVGRRVPISRLSARMTLASGTYQVSSTLTSASGTASDAVQLEVFDEPTVVSVSSQGALNTQLQSFKASSSSHLKIVLASGSYYYPVGSQYDLSTSRKLVSIEANGSVTFLATNPVNLKYGHWLRVIFSNPTGAGFTSLDGSCHVFRRCQFSNSLVGLLSPIGSYARVEDCHAHTLGTGFVNVDVIRGLSWTKISGVVFYDCSVIESTIGIRALTLAPDNSETKKQCIWANFDRVNSNISIRDNVLLGDYSTVIMSNSTLSNVMIVGNTFKTTGKICIQASKLESSFIGNNTIVCEASTFALQIQSASRNCIVNNYFSTLGSPSRILADTGTWVNNAFTTGSRFGGSIQVADPVFTNNYYLLGSTSPLKSSGSAVYGYSSIQGLPVASQIGSMPFHPDKDLNHIYFHMRGDSFFGFSMPAVVIS